MKLLPPNDPRLNQKSAPVLKAELNTKKLKKIIDSMTSLAMGEQKDKSRPVLVGLAAPQTGILKRIILVDTGADGKGKVSNLKFFLNPEIVFKSKVQDIWYEGCFSTGNICGIVKRAHSVKIRYQDIEGKVFVEKYQGYLARIFQHEIDHLEGIRFPDLLFQVIELHLVQKNEFLFYRNKSAWKKWPKKAQIGDWNKIKNK